MSDFDDVSISMLKNLAQDIGLSSLEVCSAPLKVKSHFPWAKSVISVSLPFIHLLGKNKYLPSMFISLSALDSDYHTVLRDKLKTITKHIHSNHDYKAEILVDTNLFSERMTALLSKTCWFGKNNNVFTDRFGSFIALGEIVTDIEYSKVNSNKKNLCGSCRKCIDSCPTGALTENGGFDAKKCLSSITQSSGFINLIYLPLLETRIFGCDTCQNVCPHNIEIYGEVESNKILGRGSDSMRITYQSPLPRLVKGELEENTLIQTERIHVSDNDIQWLLNLLNADNAYFKEHIKNKTYGWIGRNKLRRNAAIVAGNLKLDIFAESLYKMLIDPQHVIRATAAWALDQIDSPNAYSRLKSAIKLENSEDVLLYLSNILDKYINN